MGTSPTSSLESMHQTLVFCLLAATFSLATSKTYLVETKDKVADKGYAEEKGSDYSDATGADYSEAAGADYAEGADYSDYSEGSDYVNEEELKALLANAEGEGNTYSGEDYSDPAEGADYSDNFYDKKH